MRLEWLPRAKYDLEGQLDYLEERNSRAAFAMGDAIERAVRHLIDYPELGRVGRVAGTRELVAGGTPYVVVYRVYPGIVVVLRLLHGAQRRPTSY